MPEKDDKRPGDPKAERLAKALRENLRRRKAQARASGEDEGEGAKN